jgi:hypothetical protein
MNLNLVSEMWDILKPNIQVGDVNDAAESLVNYLVDNDYDPQEIKRTFKGDSSIQKAVGYFIESNNDSFEEDFDDYEGDLYDYSYNDEDEDY